MRGVYLKKGNVKVTVVPYYRIGDLFLTTNATNPSSFLGGTWQLFGPGKTLVCVDTSDSDFNTVKKTGGAKTKSYTPAGSVQNHTLTVEQIPPHSHTVKTRLYHGDGEVVTGEILNCGMVWDTGRRRYVNDCYNTGGGQPHSHGFSGTAANINVVQPYITCYIWIRTA